MTYYTCHYFTRVNANPYLQDTSIKTKAFNATVTINVPILMIEGGGGGGHFKATSGRGANCHIMPICYNFQDIAKGCSSLQGSYFFMLSL